MNKLIPRISGYGDYTRVYAQTHVYKLGVCKGSQWVLFVASEQTDPPKPLPKDFESWMGNRITPYNLSELIG